MPSLFLVLLLHPVWAGEERSGSIPAGLSKDETCLDPQQSPNATCFLSALQHSHAGRMAETSGSALDRRNELWAQLHSNLTKAAAPYYAPSFLLGWQGHRMGDSSTRNRNLAKACTAQEMNVVEGPRAKKIEISATQVCIEGDVTYDELLFRLAEEGLAVPIPSCEYITIFGHLVVDGHGRLINQEIYICDHVEELTIAPGDGSDLRTVTFTAPARAQVLSEVLLARSGLLLRACMRKATWLQTPTDYTVNHWITFPDKIWSQESVRTADVAWIAPQSIMVFEKYYTNTATGSASSRGIVAMGASTSVLPFLTPIIALIPFFYNFLPAVRYLFLTLGAFPPLPPIAFKLNTGAGPTGPIPNPILAPCTIMTENVEFKVPRVDWEANYVEYLNSIRKEAFNGGFWKRIIDPCFNYLGNCAPYACDEVIILDLNVASPYQDASDRAVFLAMQVFPRAVLSAGKSVPPSMNAHVLAHYERCGVTIGATPTTCFHPWCSGVEVREFCSVRDSAF